ncbi:MAG: 1-aminocyclopropane-1-carboxylate deaminase/D-cysteine desulfhydrase, partial [Flavitalea sp.]
MQPAPGFQQARIDHLNPGNIDVLRLDLVHPVISGNKWYKLRFYLEEALHSGKNSMMSFGGAWSNHIIALAAAAQMNGLKSIGLIRGEKPKELSMTLNEAIGYGMKLYFLSRSNYAENKIPEEVWDQIKEDDVYLVREGGYGLIGAAGAATILDEIDFQHYDYIMAATGTGTMLAGLALRMEPEQKLVGISVLKNNYSIT